ncbi:uncharacterized protein LOC128347301 isoform X4 [Hemicordylus capensis]|uniref:uncharacterized protein LOC128347301 isoform X4 n=1 Tax=Hemicordylus capensis TaxID=884348 RepID=UPI00230245E1|nr:uncharacterized protein LOC128347301 isoform X4 [Hemicordylus capensis]
MFLGKIQATSQAWVRGQCTVSELTRIIANLTKKNDLASCMAREFENTTFPTTWISCKWSCLQEGFENIRKNCKKPCSKCGQELEKVIERQQKISRSPKCQSIRCLETCKHSNTGTIIEFLNETKNALQIINRNEIQRMN